MKVLRAVPTLVIGGLIAGSFLLSLPARASCAAPVLSVHPTSSAAGSVITIEGEHFFAVCADFVICETVTPSPSTASPTPSPTPTTTCHGPPGVGPQRNIRVQFVQNGRAWTLGAVDARSDNTFSFKTTVPADADVGPAGVRVLGQRCHKTACAIPSVQGVNFRVTAGLAGTGVGVTALIVAALSAVVAGAALRGANTRRNYPA